MAKSKSRVTSRAVVLHESPGRLEVHRVSVDSPAAREVLVRTAAAGLCHSDLAFVRGTRHHELPMVPGHEGSGVVEDVGHEVADLQRGDHVVACASTACGECGPCSSAQPWLCVGRRSLERADGDRPRLSLDDRPVHQFRGLSTFAESMLVHEKAVTKIDPRIPLDVAALLGCAVVTGAGSVCHQSLRPASSVVVGCGGVGLNVVRAAVLEGARRVLAVDIVADKLALALAFGAHDTIDAGQGDPVAQVLALEPGGVDYVFEVVGHKTTLRQSFDMLAVGGTVYMVGVPADGAEVSLPLGALLFDRSVKGLYMGSAVPKRDIPRFASWYVEGELDLDALVSDRIPLSSVDEAYRDLEHGRATRSLVVF